MSDSSGSVVRAIRGPICLITIGGLFALNNFTRYRFEQTWPVILIVFGLLSLLKRGVETSAPLPPPPPPVQPSGYTAPSYSQSPYTQTAPSASSGASSTGSTSSNASPSNSAATESSKGGFGTSATPRSTDAPSSTPASGEGGTA
jgi:cytoskeletal protein RodZ